MPASIGWWYALGAWGLLGWLGALVIALLRLRRQRLLEEGLRIWHRRATTPREPFPTPTFTQEQSEALRAASRTPPEPPPLPAPVEEPRFPPGVIERRHTGSFIPRYPLPGERPGEFPAVRARADGHYRLVAPDAYIRPRK